MNKSFEFVVTYSSIIEGSSMVDSFLVNLKNALRILTQKSSGQEVLVVMNGVLDVMDTTFSNVETEWSTQAHFEDASKITQIINFLTNIRFVLVSSSAKANADYFETMYHVEHLEMETDSDQVTADLGLQQLYINPTRPDRTEQKDFTELFNQYVFRVEEFTSKISNFFNFTIQTSFNNLKGSDNNTPKQQQIIYDIRQLRLEAFRLLFSLSRYFVKITTDRNHYNFHLFPNYILKTIIKNNIFSNKDKNHQLKPMSLLFEYDMLRFLIDCTTGTEEIQMIATFVPNIHIINDNQSLEVSSSENTIQNPRPYPKAVFLLLEVIFKLLTISDSSGRFDIYQDKSIINIENQYEDPSNTQKSTTLESNNLMNKEEIDLEGEYTSEIHSDYILGVFKEVVELFFQLTQSCESEHVLAHKHGVRAVIDVITNYVLIIYHNNQHLSKDGRQSCQTDDGEDRDNNNNGNYNTNTNDNNHNNDNKKFEYEKEYENNNANNNYNNDDNSRDGAVGSCRDPDKLQLIELTENQLLSIFASVQCLLKALVVLMSRQLAAIEVEKIVDLLLILLLYFDNKITATESATTDSESKREGGIGTETQSLNKLNSTGSHEEKEHHQNSVENQIYVEKCNSFVQEYANLLLSGLSSALTTSPSTVLSHIYPSTQPPVNDGVTGISRAYSFLRLEASVSNAAMTSGAGNTSTGSNSTSMSTSTSPKKNQHIKHLKTSKVCCLNPCCSSRIATQSVAKLSNINWPFVPSLSGDGAPTVTASVLSSPWEEWLGIGISLWVLTGKRRCFCGSNRSDSTGGGGGDKVGKNPTGKTSPTFVICGISRHTTHTSSSPTDIDLEGHSHRPKPSHHLILQIRDGRLEVILCLSDEKSGAGDVCNISKKRWMSTVVFPSLPEVTDDTWHHICFGVIPQREKEISRITVWLDGMIASCVTPKAEASLAPDLIPATSLPSPPPRKGNTLGTTNEFTTIANIVFSAEIAAANNGSVNKGVTQSAESVHSDSVFSLDVGPFLILNQPVSLAHVAMVLYAAGPGYTGVFLGEQGDGSVSLHPERCCYSLLEAMETKNAREFSGSNSNTSGASSKSRSGTSIAPVMGAFSDVEPGPLLHPYIAFGVNPSQLILAMSTRWQVFSQWKPVQIETVEQNRLNNYMNEIPGTICAAIDRLESLVPIQVYGTGTASIGTPAASSFLQQGSRSLILFIDLMLAANSSASLVLTLRLFGQTLRAVPDLREVCVTGHFYPILMSILEEKAVLGLLTEEVAVELGILCCCESTVRKKKKKVIITTSKGMMPSQHSHSKDDLSSIPNPPNNDANSSRQEPPQPGSMYESSSEMSLEQGKDGKDVSPGTSSVSPDILLVDPPLLSLLLGSSNIWIQTTPESTIAFMNFLLNTILAQENSCTVFNRRQLLRARGIRGLILLSLHSSLQKSAFLAIVNTLDGILTRDFANSEDLLQLVNVGANLALVSSPQPSGITPERNPSFGDSQKASPRSSPRLGQKALGVLFRAAQNVTFYQNSSDNEDNNTDDVASPQPHQMFRKHYEAQTGSSKSLPEYMNNSNSKSMNELNPQDISQQIVILLRKRHAICSLLSRAANISHIYTTTSTPPSTQLIDTSEKVISNNISTNKLITPSTPQTRPPSSSSSPLSTAISAVDPLNEENLRARGQQSLTMLMNTYSFAKMLYIIFQFSDVSPTKHHQHIPSHGPVRGVPKRRDPFTGVLSLQMLVSILPHISGAMSRSARNEWGADLELCLPGLFSSLLVHKGGAIDEMTFTDYDQDVESEDIQRLKGLQIRNDMEWKAVRQEGDQESQGRGVGAGPEEDQEDEEDISENETAEDLEVREIDRQIHSGRSSPVPSETSSVSSCMSNLAASPQIHNPSQLLHLTAHRKIQNSPKINPSLPFDSLYFRNATDAITFAEEGASEADMVGIFGETLIDLLLGSAGLCAVVGEYLIRGWNVKDLEPNYTHPTEPPPAPIPSYVGICSGVSLGAFLAVAREAARCSTQVSLLYSRADLSLKYASWPHPDLERMSQLSSSFCVTLLCSLSTILRGDNNPNSSYSEKAEEEAGITSPEDFEVLMQGIVQVFYAAARARFLEALGPEVHLIEVLRILNSEDQDHVLPNEVIYGCCGSSIGRLCVQQLTCLTVSQSIRGLRGLNWEEHLACLPMPMYPQIPKIASTAISLILNAAVRRRHVVAMSYLAIGLAPKLNHPSEPSDSDIERKIIAFLNTSAILLPSMSQQVNDIIIMEIDLDRNTGGGMGNPTGRLFTPIKSIFELCRRVGVENKRLRDIDNDRERERVKDNAGGSASSLACNPAAMVAPALSLSNISSTLTSSIPQYMNLGFSNRLLSRNSTETASLKEPPVTHTDHPLQNSVSTPAISSSGNTGQQQHTQSQSSGDLLQMASNFFRKNKNIIPSVKPIIPPPPKVDITSDIEHAIGLGRMAFCHIIEEYIDNITSLLNNLKFFLEWVDILLSWRRTAREEEEGYFVAYLVWRLHTLLYDDHADIQSLSMRIWSLLLRSTLGTAVRSLLVVPVTVLSTSTSNPSNSLTTPTATTAIVDLWDYDGGGFHLLYVDLDVLIANKKNEINESILKFQAWLGSLPERIRESFVDKLNLSSSHYRSVMRMTFDNTVKSLNKKWHIHRTKLISNYELLISRLNKSHSRRRKETKDSQAIEIQKQKKWRHALNSLRMIGDMRLNVITLNNLRKFSFTVLIPPYKHSIHSLYLHRRRSRFTLPDSRRQSLEENQQLIQQEQKQGAVRWSRNYPKWITLPEVAPTALKISSALKLDFGLDVLTFNRTDSTRRSKGRLMSIVSLGHSSGEWALDSRFGINFTRRRLRRSNLVVVPIKENEVIKRSADVISSKREEISRDVLVANFIRPPLPSSREGTPIDDGVAKGEDPQPVIAKAISVDEEDIIGGNIAAPLPSKELEISASFAPRPDANDDTTTRYGKQELNSNSTTMFEVTPPNSKQPPVRTASQPQSTDDVLPFLSPGEKLVMRLDCNQVMGMDSYICELFLGSKLMYLIAMNATVVHDDDEDSDDNKFVHMGSSSGKRLKTLLYVKEEEHMLIDNPVSNQNDFKVNIHRIFLVSSRLVQFSFSRYLTTDLISLQEFYVSPIKRDLTCRISQVWLPWLTTSRTSGSGLGSNSGHGPMDSSGDRTIKGANNVDLMASAEGRNMMLLKAAEGGGPVRYLQQWRYSEVIAIHRRRYLLAHVALEIFWTGGRSSLFVFPNTKVRDEVANQLLALCSAVQALDDMSAFSVFGSGSVTPLEGEDYTSSLWAASQHSSGSHSKRPPSSSSTLTGAISSFTTRTGVDPVTESWVSGRMSNFEYLMYLNILAGRTFSDWSQYPIMPWIIKDYISNEIDLSDPSIYRDLSKPMGAQSVVREREARSKYIVLSQEYDAEDTGSMGGTVPPFHFGTHYASSAIVMHYLIRLQPFSSHSLALQKGRFDQPDRLFSSIGQSWFSASGGVTRDPFTATTKLQDVKELIPEFFYLPDFLDNINGYDFGVTDSGVVVDNVEVPPWANNSPREFIRINREALESPFVSTHLHQWIDLIFGYKQRGKHAEEACNVYHFLSYEGSVDLTTLKHGPQRQAYEQQIRDFGQTPTQLFKTPHPQKRIIRQAPSSSDLFGVRKGADDGDDYTITTASTHSSHDLNPSTSLTTEGIYNRLNWLAKIPPSQSTHDSENTVSKSYTDPNNSSTTFSSTMTSHLTTVPVGIENLRRRVKFGCIGQIRLVTSNADVLAIPKSCTLLSNRNDVLLRWCGVGHPYTFQVAWYLPNQPSENTRPSPHVAEDFSPDLTTQEDRFELPSGWMTVRSFDFHDRLGPLGDLVLSEGGKVMVTSHANLPIIYIWKIQTQFLVPSTNTLQSSSTSSSLSQGVNSLQMQFNEHNDIFTLEHVIPCGDLTDESSRYNGSGVVGGICAGEERFIRVISLCVVNGIFVTASADNILTLWTLSNLHSIRILSDFKLHDIACISINKRNGDIYIGSGKEIYVCDVNGNLKAIHTDMEISSETEKSGDQTVTAILPLPMMSALEGSDGVLVGLSNGLVVLFSIDCNVDNIPCRNIQAVNKDDVVDELFSCEESLMMRWYSQAQSSIPVKASSPVTSSAYITALAAKQILNGTTIRICAGSASGEMFGWDICLIDSGRADESGDEDKPAVDNPHKEEIIYQEDDEEDDVTTTMDGGEAIV